MHLCFIAKVFTLQTNLERSNINKEIEKATDINKSLKVLKREEENNIEKRILVKSLSLKQL